MVMLREGKSETDLVDRFGFSPVHVCRQAAQSVNGAPLDYIVLLERASLRSDVGRVLSTVAKRLEQGEDTDIGKATSALARFEMEQGEFVRLSDVTPENAVWVPSNYPPLDAHVGGFPKSGLTVIAGPTGVGKTTLLGRIMTCMAQQGRETAFFSLEMTVSQILFRFLEIQPDLTSEQRALIHTTDSAYNVEEIYAAASRLIAANPKIELIGIDFADLLVEGEEKTAKTSAIYRTLALLARRLERPIVLLSQLNRETYSGGLPKVHHIRWSGMAEATASLILLIYNPDRIFADSAAGQKGNPLVYIPDGAYIIVGKSRFGFTENHIGAILVDWTGSSGWGMMSRGYTHLQTILATQSPAPNVSTPSPSMMSLLSWIGVAPFVMAETTS